MSLKKGMLVTGEVTGLSFPNKGTVKTAEGDVFQTKCVLPGQEVTCRIKKSRKSNAEGTLVHIDRRSFLETKKDVCPHFESCGGCLYQSIPYEEELKLKEAQLREIFAPVFWEERRRREREDASEVDRERIPDFDEIWEGILPSPIHEAYRNKMEFSFGDAYKDGPLALGMHKRGSFYDIVTVDDCRIIDGDMQKVLATTLSYFAEKGVTYRHKQTQEGYLRHLLVRKAKKTGELLVALVHSSEPAYPAELLQGWKDVLLTNAYEGSLCGVLHIKNDRIADVIADEGTEVLYGRDYFYEELLGLRFRITPFSFFQTNSLGAEVLYEKAREYILGESGETDANRSEKRLKNTDEKSYENKEVDLKKNVDTAPMKDDRKTRIIYDLYSGTGTIAQMLSPAAEKVIGVEIVEEAVEAAKQNAKENGLTNCEFLAGDVLKVLDEITEKPDFIILDPPRDGVHPKALPKILSYGVNSLIYISCKPTSLARDLPHFFEKGYTPTRMCAVDMFPGTGNVEVICSLSKQRKPDAHIDIELTAEEYENLAGEEHRRIMDEWKNEQKKNK